MIGFLQDRYLRSGFYCTPKCDMDCTIQRERERERRGLGRANRRRKEMHKALSPSFFLSLLGELSHWTEGVCA